MENTCVEDDCYQCNDFFQKRLYSISFFGFRLVLIDLFTSELVNQSEGDDICADVH